MGFWLLYSRFMPTLACESAVQQPQDSLTCVIFPMRDYHVPCREVKEAVGSDGDDPGPLEDAEYLVLERELQLADRRVLRQLPVPLHMVLGPLGPAQT